MYSAVLLAETAEKQGAVLIEPLPTLKTLIMELTHTYNVRKVVFITTLGKFTGRGGAFRPGAGWRPACRRGPHFHQ